MKRGGQLRTEDEPCLVRASTSPTPLRALPASRTFPSRVSSGEAVTTRPAVAGAAAARGAFPGGGAFPSPVSGGETLTSPARRCRGCGRRAGRYAVASRTLHDLGDPRWDCPVDLVVTYSKHRCHHCDCHFSADLS